MAKKKENKQAGVEKKQPNMEGLIVQDFRFVSPDRNRKDVGMLKTAIERAESVTIPNRYKLIDLYHDVVTIDGHLSGLLEKRTKAVTNKGIVFYDSSGKKVDQMDTLIKSQRFERLVEILMETIYWGTSAVEFVQGSEFCFVEIDRRHIRPEAQEIALSQFDTKGVSVFDLPMVWLMGEKHNLGRLLQCSMYALYKRSGFGDFAQYVEIFGQPVRVVKYDAYDSKTQEELRKALNESGSSLVMMIPKQADFSMLDGKTSNGNGELQEKLINCCNQEMSVAILGNSETTTSSSSSGYAQAEVHAGQQMEITLSYMRYVAACLNSPYFLSVLRSYGYPVDGGEFKFEQERDLTKLKARLDIDLQVSSRVPVSDDYWYETYGVPKPDNYDDLKKAQEEQRAALLQAIKSSTKKDEDDDPEPDDDPKQGKKGNTKPGKKKDLADRLADFFGFAPIPM